MATFGSSGRIADINTLLISMPKKKILFGTISLHSTNLTVALAGCRWIKDVSLRGPELKSWTGLEFVLSLPVDCLKKLFDTLERDTRCPFANSPSLLCTARRKTPSRPLVFGEFSSFYVPLGFGTTLDTGLGG